MKAMGLMTSHVSTLALCASDHDRSQKGCEDNGFEGLNAVDSISIIGQHDGLLDDDLFDLLSDEAA